MPLFQNTVITKYLKTQNDSNISEYWQAYKNHFLNPTIQENIRNSKEEQYQAGFLRDLFVNILGYTLNPDHNFNLTTELKNVKDSKKADGGIIINEKVFGVIELKGTNTTDLAKVETQAFGYKNNQPECVYVITSNFEKLRFYIDNAIEHIEFNLFTLTEEDFNLLYLCIAFKNIKNHIPKKLKDESISQEELITNQLYKDYSLFKRELFQDLTKQNPQFEALELFKKSQKLLDRFLFLFFSEDRNLLPPNSVRLILKQWKQLKDLDAYDPLYNRFKKYFGYLNTGFKGKQYNVFAYNGGLFKPDRILDSIKINDDLLYTHTLKLADYDFASEVDVNILGHIFENSLNELDEVKAQLEGQTVDKTNTKRKKDGVFYTPKYITKYIVENTVGKLCTQQKETLAILEEEYTTAKKRTKATKKPLLNKLTTYRDWLLQLTICDPACGSGAFLNEALNFLIQEHAYIDELQAKLFGDALLLSDVENSILENNLFGVDLNEESVEIAKLSLWLRTAQPNRKLNSLNNNIKCGNSLIDDVTVAGDKAFNWEKEFPTVFEKGGFDVVIGNPPYVRRTHLPNNIKKYIEGNYYSAFKQYDLYVLFNELALKIVKINSLIGFIQPNKFLSAEYGYKILNLLVNTCKILSIYDVSLDKVFDEASVYPYIFIYRKNNENYNFEELKLNLIEHCEEDGLIGFKSSIDSKKIIDKIIKNSIKLKTISGKIKRGLPNTKINFDFNGIYSGIKSTMLSHKYYQPKTSLKFNYKSSEEENLKQKEFSKELILLPRTVLEIRAVKKDDLSHILDRIYYFYIKNNEYSIDYILAILNSKITTFYYNYFFGSTKIGGGYIDLKGTQIEQFIIPDIDLTEQKEINLKVIILALSNKFFFQFDTKFQTYLKQKFSLEKLSKKLQNWHELDFGDFIKELNKAIKAQNKINSVTSEHAHLRDIKEQAILTKKDEFEWLDLFEENKQKAQALQTQINHTDKEIDAMVYKLYGLTEDEIKIVENS